jgi:ABC-type nickel/cobalt efflux system permease component RcnA
VIRALIAAVLLTGAAVHFGAPADAAVGYALVLCFGFWLTWPVVRFVVRRRRHAGRRRSPSRVAPITPAAPVPHLTQVNHHHYYYGGLPPAPPMAPAAPAWPRPDYTLPALPQRTRQQMAHDAIYDTIDLDDDIRP